MIFTKKKREKAKLFIPYKEGIFALYPAMSLVDESFKKEFPVQNDTACLVEAISRVICI